MSSSEDASSQPRQFEVYYVRAHEKHKLSLKSKAKRKATEVFQQSPPRMSFELKGEKIARMVGLLPKPPWTTGPSSSQFNVLEDVILLCAGDQDHRKVLLEKYAVKAKGTTLTCSFWEQIIHVMKLNRKPEEVRQRYQNFLSCFDVRVYDELISLLRKSKYQHQISYRQGKEGMVIDKVAAPSSTQLSQNQLDHEVINVDAMSYRYMTEEYRLERGIVERLLDDPKHRHITYDWVETTIAQIKYIQTCINAELMLTQKEVDFIKTFSEQQHRLQKELNLKKLLQLQEQMNPMNSSSKLFAPGRAPIIRLDDTKVEERTEDEPTRKLQKF